MQGEAPTRITRRDFTLLAASLAVRMPKVAPVTAPAAVPWGVIMGTGLGVHRATEGPLYSPRIGEALHVPAQWP